MEAPVTMPLVDNERPFESFEDLMSFRVQDILLVSSLYDSFILREDGRLNELLAGESVELHLQQIPGITHVRSGAEALLLAKAQPRYNLIVTNLYVGDMDAAQLARKVKEAGLDVPVVVLAYDYREVKNFRTKNPATDIERIFLWQGNVRILISIVKYVEDKRNAPHDTRSIGVPVMLVVEDNIRYYSAFLPVIYTEMIEQTRRVISEGLNVAHKLMRMRARPKILLCTSYEEATRTAMQYRDYLLGVISDVEFPRAGFGEKMPDAGFALAWQVREMVPDVPIVLHSSRTEFMKRAHEEGFSFLQKRSPSFLTDLRKFLVEQVAFGDFVFRTAEGNEVARAQNLEELEQLLHGVPDESIMYHSSRNHFSHWLRARTEFALARRLRPRKVSDFPTVTSLRRDLINSIAEYRREQNQLLIGDFSVQTFKPTDDFFLRIGGGSLGGKARGLAFVRHLLYRFRGQQTFPGIHIRVPPSLVLATNVFDEFLADNELLNIALHSRDDNEIEQRFLAAKLSDSLQENLRAFLEQVRYPLAVRSSSLLEDSQYQPFTGVYDTFMLANSATDEERLEQLMQAIKMVYASTFLQHAKAYVRATPYRLEEEKMAVIIQKLVGVPHESRFYPDFSGVVRSHNFYPVPPMRVEDGIATVALGLGCAVVGGGKCLTFSPRHPRHIVQFSSVDDILQNSQTEFFALDLSHAEHLEDPVRDLRERSFSLRLAEKDGTLHRLASTYSAENDTVYDGLSRPGVRIISFAPILKYNLFPLAPLLNEMMQLGQEAQGRPVEIEFAVCLPQAEGEFAEVGFLQMRPLVISREGEDLEIGESLPEQLICQSSLVLGHGRISDLRDVVVVDFQRFERGRSQQVAEQVSRLNAKLNETNTPYLLIGVGRWGSNDPWLGIPVEWDQVSAARVIVEAGFRDFRVTPSQGSHFFQNLTAFQVGYFTVNPDAGEGFVDWQWLAAQSAVEESDYVRHLHFDSPLTVVMNGKTSAGVIFKPAPPKPQDA
ncbi:MAG TPA: PEP/pyruvate-binding domain-containing protein [Candidatus Acidoferrales bacterium]|nr:PEP/pyruvate-binding domain-containing protein [Candidatus Acidoferrales bacterium]